MINAHKNLYKDYEELLIKNDKLSEENRALRYSQKLLEAQNKTLRAAEEKAKNELNETITVKDEIIKEKEFEIARLKALLNMDGTNHGIPTSQTPISKKKVIPNTRENSNKAKGGQVGHKKHKLEKFKDDDVTEYLEHNMDTCPYCTSHTLKETGTLKEKDELDFKIVVIKRRHQFKEFECEKCGKIFHADIPSTLKEENQYGPQVQTLELALMNQANVTMNKAQKITYGMTNGEIDLSEGYIAKLQQRAAKNLNEFNKQIYAEIIKQPLLYWDDTVISVDTKRSCLRFYGTEKLAFYTAHLQKNKEGLDEDNVLNVLPKETIVEHDHNKVNYNTDYCFTNAECNRHLEADLKNLIDNLGHNWAKKLRELLNKTNKKREWKIKKNETEFSSEELKKFDNKFNDIMLEAMQENSAERQDRYYVKEELTLITRILDYKENYLLWVYNFDVPFTNNLSERSLRAAKSKMKASGQFQNIASASNYATIRTYVETCYRNGINVYNALLMLSLGKPYTLKQILSGELR